MKLDLTPLENAIYQLAEALDLYDTEVTRNNPRYKVPMRAATIQAFEFTYELSFKMIRRHLELGADNPEDIDRMSFNNVIRLAYGKNLLRSDLAAWMRYRQNRAITSHTYDENKARIVFEGAPDFLDEARYLLKRLQEENRLRD